MCLEAHITDVMITSDYMLCMFTTGTLFGHNFMCLKI